MQISAFQINDRAILTVKDGEELVCSGMYQSHEVEPGVMEVDFGEAGIARIQRTAFNDDPTRVGTVPGQKRFTWSGELKETT